MVFIISFIIIIFIFIRKVEDLQFRVEEACITKGDLEVNEHNSSSIYVKLIIP